MGAQLYMVIERNRDGNGTAVYERFRAKGRMAPAGLEYVNSWVTPDRAVCYQVMRTHDRALLEEWMANWSDLVEFEVIEVITSAEAAAKDNAR